MIRDGRVVKAFKKDLLSWTLIGTSSNGSSITSDYSKYIDVFVEVIPQHSANSVTFNIPVKALESTSKVFRTFYPESASKASILAGINASLTSISIREAFTNGNDFTSTSTINVYAR